MRTDRNYCAGMCAHVNPAACYSLLMPLDKDTLTRRLVAARSVVGLDQNEMGAELAKEGLGKTDAKRLERGQIDFSNSHWAAYVRITRMPEAWFTAPDYSALFKDEAHPPAPWKPDQVLETIGMTVSDTAKVSDEVKIRLTPGATPAEGPGKGADAGPDLDDLGQEYDQWDQDRDEDEGDDEAAGGQQ